MNGLPHIILVTGWRDWPLTQGHAVWGALFRELSTLQGRKITVVHGDCHTGVDNFADMWARKCRQATPYPMPAPWKELGKGAGPARNTAMVDTVSTWQAQGHTVQALVFPGPKGRSPGTEDCFRKIHASTISWTLMPYETWLLKGVPQ